MPVRKDLQRTNITKDEIKALRRDYADYSEYLRGSFEHGIISLNEMQERTCMKRKEIVKKHEEHYSVWQGSGNDNRWITRLPDGRKVAKKNHEDLDDAIVDYYTSVHDMTVEELYTEWIVYKEIEARSSSYINKIKSDWRTYYKTDPEFISRPIKGLTVIDVEIWANGLIKKYGMSKKQYYNTSVIIRQALKYARKKGYIDKSPFEDAEINTRLFRKEQKAPSETQVYTMEGHA